MKTYNNYLTEGVLDGSIQEVDRNGIRSYLVRAPWPDEVVMGYTNFSSFIVHQTATELAENKSTTTKSNDGGTL
jgi:hypothetical protein